MCLQKITPLWVFACLGITFSSALIAAEKIDYLSFARGALPESIHGDPESMRTDYPHALAVIDGNMGSMVMTPKPGPSDAKLVFIFKLPALTTFSGFAIPNVSETPSPSQTFFRHVTVEGSSEGPDSGFELLASAELQTHAERDQYTSIDTVADKPVLWLKLELKGGINILMDKTFFEFSELLGYGSQEPVPLSDNFSGQWKGRGVLIELQQDGALVSGCYDGVGDLNGAVSGNILRATGISRSDKTMSTFVLTVTEEGELKGVRSSNGAPFKMYQSSPAPDGTQLECSEPEGPTLGCGAILYGVQFAFDSADILPESGQILDKLYTGLNQSPDGFISIEGHTSSEGSDSYNQTLSERRAQAVVDSLITRGLNPQRISASGLGESTPIAGNKDEAGRSLNRRVEVHCEDAST